MKRALITGITGQDGSYLAELLLERGYEVHGLVRRVSTGGTWRIDPIKDRLVLHEGDLLESASIARLIKRSQPDIVFNLAAQSVHPDTYVYTLSPGYGVRTETIEDTWYRFGTKHRPKLVKASAENGELIDVEVIEPSSTSPVRALGYWAGMGTWFPLRQISRHRYTGKLSLFRQKWGVIKTTPNHSVYDVMGRLVAAATRPELLPMRKVNYASDRRKEYIDIAVYGNDQTKVRGRIYRDGEDSSVLARMSATNGTLQAFLRVGGAYIAEGCAYDGDVTNRPRQTVVISNTNRQWLDGLANDLKKFYDGPVCVCRVKKPGFDPVFNLEMRSRILFKVMVHYFGKGSNRKCIPDVFFSLPNELWHFLLEPMRYGDGTLRESGFWNYATTSPKLAAQLGLVSSILGTNYSIGFASAEQMNGNYDSYRVIECGSWQPHQGGGVYEEENFDGYVYDLAVDEVENFCGGIGPVVLHNSFVKASFEVPEFTAEVDGVAVVRLLEEIRNSGRPIRFYQAASSEMFGSAPPPQDENSHFLPRSPYAVAKVYAFHMCRLYREAYGMFACNGILMNHESPRRGEEFVTRKIARGVAAIALGQSDQIVLGNLEAKRDWGHAADYVDAMYRIVTAEVPDDFVIATGEAHSVREFLAEAFSAAGVPDWEKYVVVDPKLFRPADVPFLRGDASKARRVLGWQPKRSFRQLVSEMVAEELKRARA